MQPSQLFPPQILAPLVMATGLTLTQLNDIGVLGSHEVFFMLTLLLLLYLGIEVLRLRMLHPDRWLLNPVVLCSFLTFMLGYGVTNVVFFFPEEELGLVGLVPEVTPAMIKLMWAVLVGVVAMWLGYWSPIAAHLSRPRLIARFHKRFLPKTNSFRAFAIPILVLVALGARLLQIQLGVFGYSSSYDRLTEMGGITQYLSLASGFGKVALVLASFQYFASGANQRSRKWLYVVLVVEVLFGFMSGFKSAVVMPFLIVACCQYLRRGELSKYWIIMIIVGVVLAYAVIEPFRDIRNQDEGFRGNSFFGIASEIIGAAGTSANTVAESASVLVAVTSRLNVAYIGSFAIAYADKTPSMPTGSPEFLQDIFWAPLHAFIPRFIWSSKPLGDLGLWYNQVVMQSDTFSSTAMGPFAYLYFAGGFLAVFLGFFFLGIVQRSLFFLLQPSISVPGGVVFLAMLATITNLDSSFNGIITTLFRELPLALLLQFFLFKKTINRVNRISPKFPFTTK